MSVDLLSLENPLFKTWMFYSTLLLLKMLFMSPFTGLKRFKHKAFANPEDGATLKVKPKVDENVERVRRAHLNDIENIPTFIVISLIYVLTNPAVGFATLLFRVATAARFLHTLVYAVVPLPQPSRALAFMGCFAITAYMGVMSILALC